MFRCHVLRTKTEPIPIALTAAAGVLKSRRVTVEAAKIALDFVMGASPEYGRDCDIAYVSENDLTAHHRVCQGPNTS